MPAAGTALAVTPETLHGQPCLRLRHPCGDTALVALHGAQVLSWTAGGRERLYLSPRAVWNGEAAIRGGVPLCFPQFNQRGPLPKHGFARNLRWEPVADLQADADGAVRAALHLHDDARTLQWWPAAFAARLTIDLASATLRVTLDVTNTDRTPWSFTGALHTYLAVDDIADTAVHGLDGCARWDAVADVHGTQQGPVRFAGEYDAVFGAAFTPLALQDGAHRVAITQSDTWANSVVWNPGEALCARLADMPPDGWRHMLCVEAAQLDNAIELAPGAAWQGWQALRVTG